MIRQCENVPRTSMKKMLLVGRFQHENEELVLSIKRYESTLTQNQADQYSNSIHLILSPKFTRDESLTFISNNNLKIQQESSPQSNVSYGPYQGEAFVMRSKINQSVFVDPISVNFNFSNQYLVQSLNLNQSNIWNHPLASCVDINTIDQIKLFINQVEKPINEIIMIYDSDEGKEIELDLTLSL